MEKTKHPQTMGATITISQQVQNHRLTAAEFTGGSRLSDCQS